MKIEWAFDYYGYLGRLNYYSAANRTMIRNKVMSVIFFQYDMDRLKNQDENDIKAYFAKENIKIAKRIKKRFY